MIAELEKNHVQAVTDVHLRSFPNFFLSFLGKRFLEIYYQGIVKYPGAIKLVFLDNGEITGFVVGVNDPSAFYRFLIRNDSFGFFLASISTAVRRPTVVRRLLRSLRVPGTKPKGSDVVELTSLAVLPEARGNGIGRLIVQAFIDRCYEQNVKHVFLTTDAVDNDAVNAFYNSLGFKLKRTFSSPEKRFMNEYRFDLIGEKP